MRDQLIGYLLGALDGPEQELLEKQLETDPELRRELQQLDASVELLRADCEGYAPPDGLAPATCQFVAQRTGRQPVAPARVQLASAQLAETPTGSRWSLADLVVAAGVIAAAALLFFPAIANSRFQSQLTGCQNNFRQLGLALNQYSLQHNDYFPYIPPHGNLAAAGTYAPILLEGGYITRPQIFLCPSSALAAKAASYRVPKLVEFRVADGQTLVILRRIVGGSYGYNLGYMVGDRHSGTRNRGRVHFALMADAPSLHLAGHRSANHGGRGQNVLFENGCVRYLITCQTGDSGDDVFLSDRGFVEAGLHPDDAVIGNSASRPILFYGGGGQ